MGNFHNISKQSVYFEMIGPVYSGSGGGRGMDPPFKNPASAPDDPCKNMVSKK